MLINMRYTPSSICFLLFWSFLSDRNWPFSPDSEWPFLSDANSLNDDQKLTQKRDKNSYTRDSLCIQNKELLIKIIEANDKYSVIIELE